MATSRRPRTFKTYEQLLVRSRICLSPNAAKAEGARRPLNSPLAVASFCRYLVDADQERSVVVPLTAKSRPMAVFEAAVGGTRTVTASMQHVLKVPVILGAMKVVLVHNHPSGDPTPSAADEEFFDRASEAFRLIGSRVVDSIIVARNGFWSLARKEGSSWNQVTEEARAIYPVPRRGEVDAPLRANPEIGRLTFFEDEEGAYGQKVKAWLRGGVRA